MLVAECITASLIYHGPSIYPFLLHLPIILVFIYWLSLNPQVSHHALWLMVSKFLSDPAPLAVSVTARHLRCPIS